MTNFTFFCSFLIAFLFPFALFLYSANNLEKNSTGILVNANVTKTTDRFERYTRIIYHEYEYSFNNNTHIGACLRYFDQFQLSEALHFVNLTVIPVYVCKTDVKNSRLDHHHCAGSVQQAIIFVGMILSLCMSIMVAVAFCFALMEQTSCESQCENSLAVCKTVKHRRRRITYSR